MTERVEVCSLCPTDHTEVLIKLPFPGVAVTPGSVLSRKGKTEPEAVVGSLWGLFTITHDFRLWSLKWLCASLIPLFTGSFSIPSYDCQRLPNFWGEKKQRMIKHFLTISLNASFSLPTINSILFHNFIVFIFVANFTLQTGLQTLTRGLSAAR